MNDHFNKFPIFEIMRSIKLNLRTRSETNFTIIYEGINGIVQIKTLKDDLFTKLRYFKQRSSEFREIIECKIHDYYETEIFKNFIESIKNQELVINEKNILNYFELSKKYGYQDLQEQIEKCIRENPDIAYLSSVCSLNSTEAKSLFDEEKNEIIAQNLDKSLLNGCLINLPISVLNQILNSPNRKLENHQLLFDFVIKRILHFTENETKTNKYNENIEILASCLDYQKMNESEIEKLHSLNLDLSIFHPKNYIERMNKFIEKIKIDQSKIEEHEILINQLIIKEQNNEEEHIQISNNFEDKIRIIFENDICGYRIIEVKPSDKISKYLSGKFWDLTYSCIILNPNMRFKDYALHDGSIIRCVRKIKNNWLIFFKMNGQQYLPFSVNGDTSIDYLTMILRHKKFDNPHNDIKLIYNNNELLQGTRIKDYPISINSILTLSPSATYVFPIILKYQTKINKLLYVSPQDKIQYIKGNNVWIFDGIQLDGNKLIKDYSLHNLSTVLDFSPLINEQKKNYTLKQMRK